MVISANERQSKSARKRRKKNQPAIERAGLEESGQWNCPDNRRREAGWYPA